MFNALDPSPLIGRDLDVRVESYIVETAEDAPAGRPLELVVTTPPSATIDGAQVEAAVHAYFGYLRDSQLKRVRRLLHEGRRALALGLGFLAVCTLLGQLARRVASDPIGEFLAEGLLIIGWVANWRPVEIFLYDWRPMRARARLYDRLARMKVALRES